MFQTFLKWSATFTSSLTFALLQQNQLPAVSDLDLNLWTTASICRQLFNFLHHVRATQHLAEHHMDAAKWSVSQASLTTKPNLNITLIQPDWLTGHKASSYLLISLNNALLQNNYQQPPQENQSKQLEKNTHTFSPNMGQETTTILL